MRHSVSKSLLAPIDINYEQGTSSPDECYQRKHNDSHLEYGKRMCILAKFVISSPSPDSHPCDIEFEHVWIYC